MKGRRSAGQRSEQQALMRPGAGFAETRPIAKIHFHRLGLHLHPRRLGVEHERDALVGLQVEDEHVGRDTAAAVGLIKSISQKSDTKIGVVGFSGSSKLTQPLTSNRDAVVSALQDLKRSGGTDLAAGILTALEELKKNGVTHVVWLPDSETNWLYLLMQAEPTIDLITVSREGQAFSTAAGLSVGGAKPVILIQNTGLQESGDSMRGCVMGMHIPVVLMVG